MERKSTHTAEYDTFIRLLRDTRTAAGISQEKLAKLLGRDQSILSRWEAGELRLDLVQLRDFCLAVGTTLPAFITAFEERLNSRPPRAGKSRGRAPKR
jgi:transcriptional regulator with XRE-family HTH domain